ncbi:unnamed protein product [Cuscuta epithymum]|uniref:Zinc finger PHD-type domain-containing protein n=1 Tax=Cuscuta epithymum TaxID=186058 RepID=A0AAV0FUL0_9ASTE|nr:unnamed protein product [Cuscuta epithymum]
MKSKKTSPPILEAHKKPKKAPKFFGLATFADPGCPISPTGPFFENVRFFLQQCAELEDYEVEGMPVWVTFLVHESRGFAAPLYTIEEAVQSSAAHQVCNHCRYAGWGHHLVSKRNYHFIIPADDDWNQPLTEGFLDLQTHLLHGMIHCNGFGHLLCINGIEGGSKYICGKDIMDLWDRICSNLQARSISVEDLSKKHSMDLRLLYGVAYGHSWFGRWGYRYGHGCFGVMEHDYERALQILSSLDLDQVIDNFSQSTCAFEISQTILFYRNLSNAHHLHTLRDLFRFMISLKLKLPLGAPFLRPCSSKRLVRTTIQCKPQGKKDRSARCRKFASLAACMDSRWPVRRLEFTANVIVDALREKKQESKSGMTRQEVRDAARAHIGDTGLIDHVLKSMNNVIVGSYVVRRAVNKATRVLEYTIQELNDGVKASEHSSIAGSDVFEDLYFLYTNVLLGYHQESQTVLDTKHFVKEWPFRDELDDLLRFICMVIIPISTEMETVIPKEHVVVPLHSTIGDLKLAVQAAMRGTYCGMEGFVVSDIKGLEGVRDDEVIFGIVESGTEILVTGVGLDSESDSMKWTVECRCGARDDDGERMMSCDMCEIWQHTRCLGIKDDMAVPPLFVCEACCGRLVPPAPPAGFGGGGFMELVGCHESAALIPWLLEPDTSLYF